MRHFSSSIALSKLIRSETYKAKLVVSQISANDLNFQGRLPLEDFVEVEQLLFGEIAEDEFVKEVVVLAVVKEEVGSPSFSLGT